MLKDNFQYKCNLFSCYVKSINNEYKYVTVLGVWNFKGKHHVMELVIMMNTATIYIFERN